jgi:hypothetical protein
MSSLDDFSELAYDGRILDEVYDSCDCILNYNSAHGVMIKKDLVKKVLKITPELDNSIFEANRYLDLLVKDGYLVHSGRKYHWVDYQSRSVKI